jgi:WD40 repeat protein
MNIKAVTFGYLTLLGPLIAVAPQVRAQADDKPVAIKDRPLGHGIRCVAFSPDGALLAATFGEPKERGRVVLWNVSQRKQLWAHIEDDGVPCVAFAPDGKTMAIGSYDHKVRLLDRQTGRVLKVFAGHSNYARAVAIAPDNKTLASGSWDGTVKTWDLASGQVQRTLPAADRFVYTMAYSPNGKWLMASDPGLRVWEAATGKERNFKDANRMRPGWAVFADDHGVIAACGNGTIRFWSVDSGEQRVLFKHYGSRLAYSPKARTLAVSRGGRALEMFDFPIRSPSPSEKERIKALVAQLDDDSYETREIATKELSDIGIVAEPDLRRAMKESASAEVRIRCRRLCDVVLAKPRAKLAGNTGDVEGLAFSPHGQLFAAGGKGGAVCLWRLNDLKEMMRLAPADP